MKHTDRRISMKANRVFLATGLVLAMGASVALAGVLGMGKDLKEVKAANEVTLYLEIDSKISWWNGEGAEVRVHFWGGTAGSEWPGAQMTLVSGTTNLYSVNLNDDHTSAIFTRCNPSDHSVWNRSSKDGGTPITLPSDYTVHNKWVLEYNGTDYNDGNYTGHWDYYDATNKHTVHTVLDNLGVETVEDDIEVVDGNTVPAPSYSFGQHFSGWFSDPNYTEGNEVTTITSDITVYGKLENVSTINFSVDASRNTNFSSKQALYFYAWEDNGKNNGAFPGVTFPIWAQGLTAPSDAKIIISNGDNYEAEGFKQTININLADAVNNDVLRILDSEADGKVEAIWESSIDEPAEEGYYICGNFSSVPAWRYSQAEQMTQTTGENVAYEMNFLLAVGDQLRVRSFFTDRPNGQAADQWATLGDNGYADETTGWGKKTGDNFEATKAGYYDIYAKYIGDDFMFFVAEHVDTYAISLTAKIYEGRTLVETRALDSQLAYDGTPFNPSFAAISGYVSYGVYEDASCSTEYEARTFSAAGQLYLKYMRTGYYVVGDADFTGGNIGAWNAAGGVRLTTECNDPANYLEGAVTIPDVDEAVQVRPLELTGEGTVNWLDFTLGATYSFASKNGDNLEFSKGGTYAVYVKLVNYQPVVYLNEGLAAFNTKFLSEVGGVCNEVLAGTKTVVQLQSIWADQAAAYASLSATEKAEVEALTIDGGNENGSDLEKVVAKYSYIVHKYGTAVCNDFIWGQTYSAQSNGFNAINNNNVMLITVISLSIVAVSAAGLFFIIRRRKLVK